MRRELSSSVARLSGTSSLRSIRDRVAVITGGAGGIGRAFAHRFGRGGARIVSARPAINQAALDGRITDALAADDIESVGLTCDVTDADACQRA